MGSKSCSCNHKKKKKKKREWKVQREKCRGKKYERMKRETK